ncbi:Protein CBG12202 [Caenorhabditis briggsae]|uniref:Major sperm protein n=1 Tax=Caenorhabditis briggsae TaxID=6238 RepID=A8XF04_CAEBR|nr:Protein CBG12202 [Caenorhabditis briggsae]CAP31226.2 Protein CBG12202 [Caenorhabditis briggsae]
MAIGISVFIGISTAFSLIFGCGRKKKKAPAGAAKVAVTIEPNTDLAFQADQQEQKKITLTNTHDKKIMFKIKTSDNVAYLVNPVFGTIEAGKTAEVTITRNKAPAKEAKLVIVNSVFSGDDKDLAKSFKTGKPTGGQVTIKMNAK